MMKKPLLCFRRDGSLSAYGYKCGYVDRHNTRDGSVGLFYEDGAYYLQGIMRGIHINESFRNLANARQRYNQLRRQC